MSRFRASVILSPCHSGLSTFLLLSGICGEACVDLLHCVVCYLLRIIYWSRHIHINIVVIGYSRCSCREPGRVWVELELRHKWAVTNSRDVCYRRDRCLHSSNSGVSAPQDTGSESFHHRLSRIERPASAGEWPLLRWRVREQVSSAMENILNSINCGLRHRLDTVEEPLDDLLAGLEQHMASIADSTNDPPTDPGNEGYEPVNSTLCGILELIEESAYLVDNSLDAVDYADDCGNGSSDNPGDQ